MKKTVRKKYGYAGSPSGNKSCHPNFVHQQRLETLEYLGGFDKSRCIVDYEGIGSRGSYGKVLLLVL
jgi:hypothetical protein